MTNFTRWVDWFESVAVAALVPVATQVEGFGWRTPCESAHETYVHTHRIFKVPMPKSQSGFIKALVLPLFEKVDQVGPRLACFLAAPRAHNPLCNPNVQHHILDICESRIGAVRYPVCAGGGRA